MKTAVIGLGLIGGSMAKAFKDNTDSEVYGLDINESVMLKAKLVGAIDGELTDDILVQCDRVIIALYPESTVEFLQSKADIIKKRRGRHRLLRCKAICLYTRSRACKSPRL